MQKAQEKLILFPKWRNQLEEESLIDLQERRFEEALSKLDVLLQHEEGNQEILIAKLMCLTELGRYDETIDLSETLLMEKDEFYYDFLQIYLTSLFQSEQYQLVMDRIADEISEPTLPSEMFDLLVQLDEMSEDMNEDVVNQQSAEHMEALSQAIDNDQYEKQWQLLENLRRIFAEPTVEIVTYLKDENIHPVIKTSVFKWLQDDEVCDEIKVSKFGDTITVIPDDIADMRESHLMKKVMDSLRELSQNNPTLYILLEQLLYRYVYVKFPIMPIEEDFPHVAVALQMIGAQYLHEQPIHETDETVLHYIEDIKMCEALYLSVIQE